MTHARIRRSCPALALLLATALPAVAARPGRMVMGAEAGERAARLTREIRWHESLPAALAEARASDRLVFWVQLLGRIDGSS